MTSYVNVWHGNLLWFTGIPNCSRTDAYQGPEGALALTGRNAVKAPEFLLRQYPENMTLGIANAFTNLCTALPANPRGISAAVMGLTSSRSWNV